MKELRRRWPFPNSGPNLLMFVGLMLTGVSLLLLCGCETYQPGIINPIPIPPPGLDEDLKSVPADSQFWPWLHDVLDLVEAQNGRY